MASSFRITPAALLLAAVPFAAHAQSGASGAGQGGGTSDADIVVTATRLDRARDAIQPSLGASEFNFSRSMLDSQPGGANRDLTDVLLQAPGVTQDGYGAVHVRNEHSNLQYRLNGIIVPESIGGFGQTFDPRVAQSIELITGTLPAQYGYRTSGIINLRTRTGAFDNGGEVSYYGGSHNTIEPSFSLHGSTRGLSAFVSGSYQQNDLGIDNPLPTRDAIHDRTRQWRAFGYVSDIISDSSRLSLLGGLGIGEFQIPNQPGQSSHYTVNGVASADSALLDQNQREESYYGVAAWQHAGDGFNLQVAPFVRSSRSEFTPDPKGRDIIIAGSADHVTLSSLVAGVQADASWEVGQGHTLRFGLFFQNERTRSRLTSRALPVDGNGNQTSDVPLVISDSGGISGQLYGAYAQDEWALTPELTLNVGVRFDAVRAYAREQQLSPRANMVWTAPGGGTIIHAGYARNFTPPAQELIAVPTLALFNNTTRQAPNLTADPVRAERENYFDAGVQQRLARGFTIALDSYYKAKHNLLDEGQFGAALIESPFNYATGYAWGVELRADYARGPVSLYANLARGEERASNIISSQYFFDAAELSYIATHHIYTDHSQAWTASGGGSVTIRNGIGTLVPAVDFLYGDGLRRDDPAGIVPNGGKLPSYVTASFGLTQNIDRPGAFNGVALSLEVTNLFDKTYLIRDGSGVGLGAPQYGARRGIFASIAKRF